MYNSALRATQNVIIPTFNPIIVPTGTAVQNLRTTYIGDNVTRDTYHLTKGFGRYTVALTWAIILTGKDISEIETPNLVGDEYIPEEYIPLCKESAINACNNMFEVTNSIYTERP